MESRRFQRIEEIYLEVLDRAPGDRAAFLQQACAGDPSLLQEVESLLNQSGEGLLDRPVWQAVSARYDSLDDAMIGRHIAHFEITGRLGEGGMGAVYKARDRHLDRDVALKLLLPEAVVSPDRRRRFVREAKAASGLNHPNIVHIYDIDEAEGELYIAMEYVSGKTLDQAIDRKGLPLRDVLRYGVCMADALAMAHGAGIVHRDLKPSNVMITPERVVKILDFGLAKLMEAGDPSESAETALMDSAKTREGTVVGTAAYMSPEQAEGKPVDGRSDIFSFGAVLYEMLTGRRAFAGPTRMATISSVLRDEPPPVSEVRDTVPRELERIVTRCLRKDPDRRFQHMDDLRVALEEVKEESESSQAAAPAAAKPAAGHRRWFWGAAALAVVVVAAFLAWRLIPQRGPAGVVEPVQITTVPGLAIGATYSPDGSRIAFSSNRSGWFEIYSRPANGGGSDRQITTDGKQATEPAWSPDGKWIAYHSVALHGIWIVPAAGGDPRRITEFGAAPAWSPDSRRLAFRSYEPTSLAASDWPGDGESTIWTVNADGSNLQRLTQPGYPTGQHADPSWSPDGKQVIFASLSTITMGFRGALFTADAASGELKPVSVGLWAAASPVFARDGKGIYFAGRPKLAGSNGVYYSALTGDTNAVELCRTKQAVPSRIALSPDGKSLAFTRLVGAGQIWNTDTATGIARPLYQDLVVRARVPRYSPDGNRIAFQVQSDDSTLGIWVMGADGSNPTRVAPELGNSNGASWTADSRGLLLNLFGGGKQRYIFVDLATGSQRPVFETTENVTRAQTAPGSDELIYDFGTPRNIWKRSVTGGLPKQLTFGRERCWFPAVSWDGNWIVYQVSDRDDTQIAVMDHNGGQQRVLTSGPGKRFSQSFASDNRRIAYAGFEKGVWNLYWIDRITAEIHQITHYTAYGSFVRSPAWRPDTEQMAFEYAEVKGNIERIPLR